MFKDVPHHDRVKVIFGKRNPFRRPLQNFHPIQSATLLHGAFVGLNPHNLPSVRGHDFQIPTRTTPDL
jgi:hypothetical protein